MKKQFIFVAFIFSLIFVVSGLGQKPLTIPLHLEVPVAPMPYRADGRTHLLYELHITNFYPNPLELSQIDVFNDDINSKPLGSFKDAELLEMIDYAGITKEGVDKKLIKPGERMIVFVQISFDNINPVPNILRHRLHIAVPDVEGSILTVEHKGFDVKTKTPPIISPPLRGFGWTSFNGISNITGHRRTIITMGGTARIPQRFAIDWGKLGADGLRFKNDGKKNSDYYCYGEDILAVADAIVVDVKDELPENDIASGKRAVPVSIDTIGGNYVILDIGNGYYAFYAHMIPGSLKVKIGDKVKVGEVIGKLGNSGNSSAPHLHFHISNSNSPLGTEGVPYLIKSFEVQGKILAIDEFFKGKAWKQKADAPKDMRIMEIPSENSVIRFP